jgi:hypothetical protein
MRHLLWLTLCLAGCGSETSNANPLVGSWKYNGLNETYTFNADATLVINESDTVSATSCTNSRVIRGTWSSTATMLTTTTSSGTLAVSGCTNAAMNSTAHPDPGFQPGTNSFPYTISGSTLTITGTNGPITFTKQSSAPAG